MSAYSVGQGDWIPLMDYAMKKGVSLSTLRRYIKNDKIKHRSENGRYLIWDDEGHRAVNSGNETLEVSLKKAQEEITELKMLVALYEEQLIQEKPSIELF